MSVIIKHTAAQKHTGCTETRANWRHTIKKFQRMEDEGYVLEFLYIHEFEELKEYRRRKRSLTQRVKNLKRKCLGGDDEKVFQELQKCPDDEEYKSMDSKNSVRCTFIY